MAIEVNNKYNKIYFSENYSELTLTATQHDTGRAFYFQVMKDDGTPYNCTGCSLTMYISIKGKAGKVNGTLINGENGRFKIIVPNSLLILNGKALMQLQLKNGKNKLGTLLGNMNIEKSIEAGATIGKDIWIDFEEIRRNVESVKNTEAYKQITELSELNADVKLTIQNGEKTITELNTHVQEAEQLKTGITAELNALNASKSEVNTVISNANTSKSDLDSRIASAESAGNTLDSKKNTVETVTIPNLNTAIETAETTKKNLDATDVKAKSTDTVVKATIENAETRNATIQTSADSKIAEVDGAITRLDNKIKEADGLFDPIEIVDNLVDGGRDKGLSAEQGKELFTYASNAKEKVVSALLAKGQNVTAENTFAELSEVITNMKIGYEVGDWAKEVGNYEVKPERLTPLDTTFYSHTKYKDGYIYTLRNQNQGYIIRKIDISTLETIYEVHRRLHINETAHDFLVLTDTIYVFTKNRILLTNLLGESRGANYIKSLPFDKFFVDNNDCIYIFASKGLEKYDKELNSLYTTDWGTHYFGFAKPVLSNDFNKITWSKDNDNYVLETTDGTFYLIESSVTNPALLTNNKVIGYRYKSGKYYLQTYNITETTEIEHDSFMYIFEIAIQENHIVVATRNINDLIELYVYDMNINLLYKLTLTKEFYFKGTPSIKSFSDVFFLSFDDKGAFFKIQYGYKILA